MSRSEQYVESAERIGARLCRDAIWSNDRCNWIGPSMEFVEGSWNVVSRASAPDLYSGTSGIGFFLGYLWSVTGERLFRRTADGAFQQAFSRVDDLGASPCGFYHGMLGLAWAAASVAELFADGCWRDRGSSLAESLATREPDPISPDVVSGSAGGIPALLWFHKETGTGCFLDSAVRHGQVLLGTAKRSERGWSWDTLRNDTDEHLTGYSHGTAGIARALLELHATTGVTEYLAGAEGAFRYERSWYSTEQENWPDLRGVPVGSSSAANYGAAWCHGAPGIGLSRIRAWQLLGESTYLDELHAALRTTRKIVEGALQARSYNFSLCHGLCGNGELLLHSAISCDEPSWMQTVNDIADEGIRSFHSQNNPWPCGVMGGGEVPGLMLGIAGIAYFYLRLYCDLQLRSLPSVLLVATKEDMVSKRRLASRDMLPINTNRSHDLELGAQREITFKDTET